MTLEANVGEVKFYRESGNVFEVDVLGARTIELPCPPGEKNPGSEYDLRVRRIVRTNPRMTEEAHPKIGETFTVNKSNSAGAYAGWWLLNHD